MSLEMRAVPPGHVVLRNEATKRNWSVRLRPYAIGVVPVTIELYAELGELPPTVPEGSAKFPVVGVSWRDAVEFCNRLSLREGLTPCYGLDPQPDSLATRWDEAADGYRLPTEAEWEYACRGGSNETRYGPLGEVAWYAGNSGGAVREVATRAPNAWGLHDTLGNVWEWCWDLFDTEVYGGYRVFRGGGWADEPRACRASCRRKSHPTFSIDDLGFRLARTL